MTDQIPADKVRTILEEWERIKEHADWDDIDNLVQDVRAILPTPPRPTLADMTDEQRDACTGMQADAETGERVIIIDGTDRPDGRVEVLHGEIYVYYPIATDVTPRPDLPRLKWPGDTEAEPAPAPAPALPDGWRLADHKTRGRVIVTCPEPDIDGEVLILCREPDSITRAGMVWCKRDGLTFLDNPTTKEASTPTAPDHLAVGTVIESADDPRIDALPVGSILLDRNEEATTKRPRPWGWTGLGNTPAEDEGDEPGPWTVLHIPKEEA